MKKKFNFVTIANAAYFEPLKISVLQSVKLYPESKVYIYNTGLTAEQTQILRETPQVVIVDWDMQFTEVYTKRSPGFMFKKSITMARDAFKMLIFKLEKNASFEKILAEHDFEIKIYNNFLITKHYTDTCGGNFLFIDADAFLINRFDELFNIDFDIGLTLRRQNELSFKFNACRVLNLGVAFFFGGTEKNRAFIQAWEDELKQTSEAIAIQTCHVRLLERLKPGIFTDSNKTHNLTLANTNMSIRILPCEIYNYNWIEEFLNHPNKDSVKVLHFKSSRFKTPLFSEIAKVLKIEV